MWLGKKNSKNVLKYLYTLKILHYISKLNSVAHGVKFGVLELICTQGWIHRGCGGPLNWCPDPSWGVLGVEIFTKMCK